MTEERYQDLMQEEKAFLTKEEIKQGWHYCYEWDALLIGPEMTIEWSCCTCPIKLKYVKEQQKPLPH